MSNENKQECCKCKELTEKVVAGAKDNERLAKMIRNLRQENESTGTTGGDKGYKEKFQALVEINHGWKKDYEELQMRYEMLKGEKRVLEEEEKELKPQISELEKRQGPLESELARLVGNGRPSEEQCEILKSQIIVYKEDFEKERNDREKLHEEKEKYKHKLENSEEIIRKLTAELDVCKAREESENEYISERVATPPWYQVQYTYPYQPVDQRWRMEQKK
jgi:chromosome segregation ATPase